MNADSPGDSIQGRIGPGTRIQIGPPSKPDARLALALAETLVHLPGVLEAHLPQCFVFGSTSRSALVLVVVVADSCLFSGALKNDLCTEISRFLPVDKHLDVWYLDTSHCLLEGVRSANCQILGRSASGELVTLRPWSLWSRVRRKLFQVFAGL